MSDFSIWYQKQLAYWSAYQNYTKKWFSKPSNILAYQASVKAAQEQASLPFMEWGEYGLEPQVTYVSFSRPWWEQLLANIAYAGNVIAGMLGNPLGSAAAQTIQQYYYEPTGQQPPQPWYSIHEAETQSNPLYASGTQVPNIPKVVVNVQNTLGNIGKAIQQGFQWIAQQLGRWGPIILLIIILYLVVRLVRG